MLVMMLFIDVPSAGGGDIGGGGTWNGRVGSVPCLCPYMFPLAAEEWVVCTLL